MDILLRAEARGLDVIALTDHNSVRGYANLWREIEDLELLEYLGRLNPAELERLTEFRRLLGRILVLPGFEFTAQFGFHILAIFPEVTSVRMMEHLLLLLGVPEDRFGSGEVGATTDVLRAYEILAGHGALVIGAHVNSTHGVAMQGLRFGGQTKIAYTQDVNLHALEVTDLLPASNRRSTARFFSGTKTEYPRRMHCIQGSDAHRLEQDAERETNLGVGDRPTELLLPEVSFSAIKDLLTSQHFDRTRPYTPPPSDPVKAARLDGNTSTQAFHESVASKRGILAVVRDAVALANASGGQIYLGVSPVERRPVAGVNEPTKAVVELQSELNTQIEPHIECVVDLTSTDGKPVIVVTVPEGSQKPYAVVPGGIYIRRGGESAAANRDEIVRMVQGGASAQFQPTPPSIPEAASIGDSPISLQRKSTLASNQVPRQGPDKPRSVDNRPTLQLTAEKLAPQLPDSRSAENGSSERAEVALESYEEVVSPDPITPTTGVEVIDSFEQDGTTYYTLRDLRYHKLVHNVTRHTDRRLWRAAITQREKSELDESTVNWDGDFGLWRSYRQRTGDRRYDLVYRGDGDPRVFYGVSEAGMVGRWKPLLATAKLPS